MSCESTWARLAAGESPDPVHVVGCVACATLVEARVPQGVVAPNPRAIAGRVRARRWRRRVVGGGALLALVALAGAGWRAQVSGAALGGAASFTASVVGEVEADVGVLDVLDAADAALDARADTPADDLLALLEPSAEDPFLAADDLHALAAPSHPTSTRSP